MGNHATTVYQASYKNVGDKFSSFPVLGMIAQNYIFSGRYAFDLSIKEMRIDHMATSSTCPIKNRGCVIGLSFTQPVGTNMFSTRFDMPVISAPAYRSHWEPATVGDYVVHLSNEPVEHPYVQLMTSVRF